MHFYKITFTVVCCFLFAFTKGQIVITGTVLDSTKTVPVKDVIVKSTSGTAAVTDSNGRYTLLASIHDSLIFIYQNRPTLKFAVSQIPNTGVFDISLHVRVNEKYKRLKEIKVYAKNYRQDSIANREQYAKIFDYQKPGIKVTTNSYSGTPGADLDELINVFRFKRNKQLKRMQLRLEEEEKEKYIDYRFNKTTVRRITGLDGKDLDDFMKAYRPGYEFTVNSDMVDFYQYILNASYEFTAKKERENFIDSRFNKDLVRMATNLPEKDLDAFMKKYRPGYEFTKNSSAAEFYQYLRAASSQFTVDQQLENKKQEPAQSN